MNAGTVLDFSTPGDWTTIGDGQIASSRFSLVDPKTILYWTTHHWSVVPSQESGTGDRELGATDTYRITRDGTPYDLGDYSFVFNLKMKSGGSGTTLLMYHHWTQDVTPTRIETMFYRVTTADLKWYIFHSDSYKRIEDRAYGSTTYGWPEGTYRQVKVALRGSAIRLEVPGARGHMLPNLDMDDTDGGDIALKLQWGGGKWVLGDGEFGTQPTPYVCQRKQGGVQLKEASCLDLSVITSLDRITVLGDLTGGGDIPLPADLRYNHYTGVAWTGWTAVPDDGDVSALSCGAGKKLLVGITDGSTAGLDTMCDTAWESVQAEYAPIIDGVLVTYAEPSSTNIGVRRGGLTGGPRRGAKE